MTYVLGEYCQAVSCSYCKSPLLWVLGPVWVCVFDTASSCPWMLHFPGIIFITSPAFFFFHCFCCLICVCWCMYVVVGCIDPSTCFQRPEYSLPQSLCLHLLRRRLLRPQACHFGYISLPIISFLGLQLQHDHSSFDIVAGDLNLRSVSSVHS